MDSFVIVCFNVEKHYIPQFALTNKLSLCLFKLIFEVIAILVVIKSCTCSYTSTRRLLIPRSCAYLDSLGNFGFRVKLGFKNKCQL